MPYKDPEAVRAYHVINRERARERVRKWRENNPDEVQAQAALRAARDPEDASRRGRQWRAVNGEQVKAYEKSRVRDPAQVRAYELSRDRRAGGRRDASTRAYVKVLLGDPCSYCGGISTGVDHIRSLANDGIDGWDNLTGCCARCNSSKNATDLLLWMTRRA